MAIITCGSTWVARWGVQPQLTTSSAMNKLTTPSHFFSTKIRALRSPSSSMFSQNSLRTLFNTRSSKSPCHHRGARLIVRAVSLTGTLRGVTILM